MALISRRTLRSESGATMLEYLCLLSGLNCALIVAVSVLGTNAAQPYYTVGSAIGGPESLSLIDNGDGGGSQSTQQGNDSEDPESVAHGTPPQQD